MLETSFRNLFQLADWIFTRPQTAGPTVEKELIKYICLVNTELLLEMYQLVDLCWRHLTSLRGTSSTITHIYLGCVLVNEFP